MMNMSCVYHIQIKGQVVESEINAMIPLEMVCEWTDTAVTQFSVHTDQSGLIGLMRHLHNRGITLQSVVYELIEE